MASARKSLVVVRAPGSADDSSPLADSSEPRGSTLQRPAAWELRICGFTLSLRDVGLIGAVLVLHTGVTSACTRRAARAKQRAGRAQARAARRTRRAQAVPPQRR
jgi:hypothetical protein